MASTAPATRRRAARRRPLSRLAFIVLPFREQAAVDRPALRMTFVLSAPGAVADGDVQSDAQIT
jgi:hypothetical protein